MPSRSPPCRVKTRQLAFQPHPSITSKREMEGFCPQQKPSVSSFDTKVVFPTNDRTRKGRAEEHEKEQRAGVHGTPAILIHFYFIY